jgi:hypothetical protein
LCFFAGKLDVEKWMTRPEARRILNFWEAVDSVWPLPDPWTQSAMVCSELSKVQALQWAEIGQKVPSESYEKFMPPRYKPAAKPSLPPVQSAKDQAAILDKVFGNW